MTTAILSPSRTSTSGRAPWFNITIRFWIRVESLKRPPTLLTIASSFKSSSMASPFSGRAPCGPRLNELRLHDLVQPPDRRVEVVVDDLELVLRRPRQLLAGVAQ